MYIINYTILFILLTIGLLGTLSFTIMLFSEMTNEKIGISTQYLFQEPLLNKENVIHFEEKRSESDFVAAIANKPETRKNNLRKAKIDSKNFESNTRPKMSMITGNRKKKSPVNDDYCDDANGSDEKKTSACSHLTVHKRIFDCGDDEGDELIYSSRVVFLFSNTPLIINELRNNRSIGRRCVRLQEWCGRGS